MKEMEALQDLSKVCRLCLQGGDAMYPIFTSNSYNNGSATLSYRIMSCAKVKLVEGDGLPSNVCTTCLAQVDRSYQFKLVCEKSELTLRGFIRDDDFSSDTESLDGSEPWDMTKFTPEVIIKEEADEGILVENGLSPTGNQSDSYLPHAHIYPHHLYPLQQVEELLRNHGTEIKIQVDQNEDSSNNVSCASPNVPVSLAHPTTLLVTHRLLPLMNHHQQRGLPSGVSSTATAVLVTTNTPPPASGDADLLQQKKQLDQSRQAEPVQIQQNPQHQHQKVTSTANSVPLALSQQLNQNGSALHQNHNLQEQQMQQKKAQPDELLSPQGTLESNSLSSKSRRCRGGDKLFKCSQCSKSYSFSSALSRHKAVHNKELRPHICKICNKGFTHSDKLLRHQKTHSIDVFMNCDNCNRPFKSYPSYQKHKQSGSCEATSGRNSLANWCDSCNVEVNPEILHNCNSDNNTDNDISLQVAAESSPPNSTTREQPPEDEDPPESSSSPAHPNSKKTKGKSDYKCKVCLKYFATKGSLEVHSTIHTGIRPFVCSACGKSFRHKVNLMEHFQRKHSQVRPYICDVCAARFVTKQELVRHYRKHIGD